MGRGRGQPPGLILRTVCVQSYNLGVSELADVLRGQEAGGAGLLSRLGWEWGQGWPVSWAFSKVVILHGAVVDSDSLIVSQPPGVTPVLQQG